MNPRFRRSAIAAFERVEYRQMFGARRPHFFWNRQRNTARSHNTFLPGLQHLGERKVSAMLGDQRMPRRKRVQVCRDNCRGDIRGEKGSSIGGLDYQSRRAVYAADISKAPTFFDPQNRYSNFKALTEEFLAPGILSDHRPTGSHAVIYRRDPDSVFVLHYDKLGGDGRLHLARVAGPGGKILWNIPLRLSVLQSLMLDEQSLVLSGVVYKRQDPNARVKTDPMHTANGLLLSVNWATGAVSAFDHGDVDHHPEATPLQ